MTCVFKINPSYLTVSRSVPLNPEGTVILKLLVSSKRVEREAAFLLSLGKQRLTDQREEKFFLL